MTAVTLNTAALPVISPNYWFEKHPLPKYTYSTLPLSHLLVSLDAKLQALFISANKRYFQRTSRTIESQFISNFVFLYPVLVQRRVSITFLEDIAKINIKGKVQFLMDFNFKNPDKLHLVGYMANNGVYKISEIYASEMHSFIQEKECNIQKN